MMRTVFLSTVCRYKAPSPDDSLINIVETAVHGLSKAALAGSSRSIQYPARVTCLCADFWLLCEHHTTAEL
jgi:hypothetical protein